MNTDEARLPELTRRQEEILGLIVRAHSETTEPISSKHLVEAYNLNFSSATIRNEMSVLEELGYINAPHKSAGRIPTESGYRYFVKRLIPDMMLSPTEQNRITEKLQGTPATEQWMRVAASVLSRANERMAALVTPPIAETSRYKHLELIMIQGRLVLMVLVLQGGAVHQQMLTLAEPVTQGSLSDTADRVNQLCQNLEANELRLKGVQMGLLGREVIELVSDLMEQADRNQPVRIYREGLSEIISAFQSSEGAQQALRVFEERAFLNIILNDLLTPINDEVEVVIAGNGRWEELSHLSMVLSRYGIPGQASGAVGLLGPTHINYGRAITMVRYVSGLMTDMMTTLYEVPPARTPDAGDDGQDADDENQRST